MFQINFDAHVRPLHRMQKQTRRLIGMMVNWAWRMTFAILESLQRVKQTKITEAKSYSEQSHNKIFKFKIK